ncbi:MAG: hypothetical protein J0L77_07890 [Alphaproteobacteria bacterium]|nr:hypothetical protein [Alphaproteobacteria bacterium]
MGSAYPYAQIKLTEGSDGFSSDVVLAGSFQVASRATPCEIATAFASAMKSEEIDAGYAGVIVLRGEKELCRRDFKR